ncbi:hypothetical protein BHQ21_14210 [Mycobacterium sherrisii]|uniref:PPE family protein n=1 Tax=Mycobacterium sherrisii TaxID=243061 RepID=A0A1E3ST42_9MYCO|nr:PPE family protein [Mycobacterium sherrisii]ODR05355.1 hypothetical protein BHQ21_14210 [Mycobacterium sherrisii]
MDFAMLPPEVNSGRIYAGPGSAPLTAVAAAWDGLADDLYSAANADRAVISELTNQVWSGPAATAMATAAAPFVEWTVATAAQAQQAAIQARVAAAAFDTAFAMTVPPPVITANRSLLQELIATNVLGQNFPLIAATEADYAEMWAQDATAMYSYAAASAAASTLTPFTAPEPVTKPAGLAAQVGALAQATGTPAGAASTQNVLSAMSRLLTEVPLALQQLAQGGAPEASGAGGPLSSLLSASPLQYLSLLTPYSATIATTRLGIQAAAFTKASAVAVPGAARTVGLTGPATQSDLSRPATDSAATPVSAQVGRAALAGGLSVPPTWATSVPADQVRPTRSATTLTSAASPLSAAPSPTGVISDMSMAPVLRSAAGSNSLARRARARTTVMVHYPSGG